MSDDVFVNTDLFGLNITSEGTIVHVGRPIYSLFLIKYKLEREYSWYKVNLS